MVAVGEVELITDDARLLALIAALRSEGSFGYDSEFIGEQSYHPELCLIQVATATHIALIDPTCGLDLAPFWELVADESAEKVVHAGQPDLEPVVRHLDQPPRRIFDTQIAGAFVGLPYPMALGKLVAELTGGIMVHAGSNLKFSKWNHRPLSPAQVRYAADDVRYLPLVRHALVERLNAAGHADWAVEECRSLSQIGLYRFDPQTQRIRVRGVKSLGRRRLSVLHALVAWRDVAAREQNVPPRSLLRDEILYALSKSPAQSVDDLRLIRGLPRPVEQRYGRVIVETTAAALAQPIDTGDAPAQHKKPRVDFEEHDQLVQELWAAIEIRCAQRSIAPGIVTSKRELDGYCRALHHGPPPPDHRLITGWRRELLDGILPTSG